MNSDEKVKINTDVPLEEWEKILQQRIAYGDFLNHYPWQWFVTVHFHKPVQQTYAVHCLREWNIKVCTTEKLQTAYIAVLTYRSHIPHFHVLMFGRNKYGKTLRDVPRHEWEKEWLKRLGIKNRRLAQILSVKHKKAVSYYIAHYRNMILPNSDRYELVTYNQKLLRKWDSQVQIKPHSTESL